MNNTNSNPTGMSGSHVTFRDWCRKMWYEHCDEVEAWTGQRVSYLSTEYFNKYKWWLRREYRVVVKKQQNPLG